MLVLVNENFYASQNFLRQEHFSERFNQRMSQIDLSYADESTASVRMGRIFKLDMSKYDKAVVKLLSIDINKKSKQFRNRQGRFGYVINDKGQERFFDEIWVIFKHGNPVTVMLLHSFETKNIGKLKSYMKTKYIFNSVNQLEASLR